MKDFVGIIMLKELFSMYLLALAFFIFWETLSPSVSLAEDVWFYSYGPFDCYLVTEKIVRGQGTINYFIIVNKTING